MSGSRVVRIACLGFLGGVLIESYFDFGLALFLLALALGVVLLAIAPRMYGIQFLLFVSLAGAGAWLTHGTLSFWGELPESVAFVGETVVIAADEPNALYQPIRLRPLRCDGACPAVDILYRAPLLLRTLPGDSLSLTCDLSRPKNFDPSFDYRSYLAGQGVGYVCEEATLDPVVGARVSWWRGTLGKFRLSVMETLRRALPEPEAGLSLGLVLGGNDFLSREQKDMFARTGLSHIVAVSGFNLTVLIQAALLIGLLFGLARRHALLFALLFIGLFLLLVGAPSSGIRAALMALATFGAYMVGRLSASLSALLLAAVMMLLFQPLLLRYDVGFQLSVLATLALIAGGPYFELFLPLERLAGKILAIPLYTILVELFTLPLLLGTFGQASFIAPLANLAVLPVVPVAMLLSLILLPFFFLIPPLMTFLAFPLWALLAFQVHLVEWFATLPFGLVEYSGFGVLGTVSWYLFLGAVFFFLARLRHTYVFRLDH